VKKILKVLGILVGVLVLAVAGGAAFIALDWPVKAAVKPVDVKIEYTPERVARGRKLATSRCVFCHYDQQTGALTGHMMTDAPKEFGTIYSHNITKHPTAGAGRYTDGELVYLLRTGIRRDGQFTGPFMQSPFLADEDIYSIISFLRSDDPLVAPHDNADRNWQPTFLAKLLMHVAFKPMEMPKGPIAPPDPKDQVALGKYVSVALGDCFVCHSADFKTLNSLHPEQSGGYFGGGNMTLDAVGNLVRTANLTMDEETGIGKWTEEEFVYAVRSGVRKDGRALRFPMMPFGELSAEEVRAVFAYLKTVPPIKNAVDRGFDKFPGMTANAGEGEKLYFKYACSSCHGPAGVGVCDLRKASKTYDTDAKLSEFIHDPSKFVPGTKMPTWAGAIPETDFPALIAHVHSLERAAAGGTPAATH
jgi:mono/diheme cytochrome c family protein